MRNEKEETETVTERRRFVESGKEEMVLKTRMDKETVGVEDGSKSR